MRGSALFLMSCLSILGVNTVGIASSLLVPTKFPKTAADASFMTRNESKAADYDRFSELSPYEKFVLETADEYIHRQIDQDLAFVQTNNQQNVPARHVAGYCQTRQPGIPQDQKIPFGSPVLHDHFIFCSPYGDLNRGSGCRAHIGYDIGCTPESFNRPVFTPADGVVKLVKPNRPGGSAGNYIIIDHGNGFETWFLHLNQIFVSQNQHVSAGCQIGTIGNTGGSLETIKQNDPNPHFSSGISHLHYEIHYTGSLSSVTTDTGKTLAITHAWPNKTDSPNTQKSIDPTQFICVYDNFQHGYCGKTFPYLSCK